MENNCGYKVLYIIVNAGFADEVVEIIREAGAGGATIINARGTGSTHKEFLGITIDAEKEIVLSLVDGKIAKSILSVVKEKMGSNTEANGICFIMPVDNMTTLNKLPPSELNK